MYLQTIIKLLKRNQEKAMINIETYSSPKSAVCAKSTADMLANSGLKYAYAQSKGRWVNMGDHKVYIEGDLDRSRKKVCSVFLYYQKTLCL